ncbi:MAG TPA: response regulator transcription factor [Candidatus Didemnitutus sp.]|jgi:DNA-binding NarL/FixJ family response regulator
MPTTGPIILCVEDDALLREFLAVEVSQVAGPNCKVIEACDGKTGLRTAREHHPSLVILDLMLPDMHGLAVAAGLSVLSRPPRVLILTSSASDATLSRIPYTPIHGFVLKTHGHRAELDIAIKKLLAGESYFPTYILARIDAATSDPSHFSKVLTTREIELLPLFGYGWSDEAIALHAGIDLKTVASFERDLIKKLQLNGERELMRWAQKHGFADYVFEPRPPVHAHLAEEDEAPGDLA